jgi:hypothetical protein
LSLIGGVLALVVVVAAAAAAAASTGRLRQLRA